VFAVAVGAGGGVLVPFVKREPVNAGVVLAALRFVAPPADLLHAHLVDRRGRVEAVPGVVGAMAVDTGRSPGIAAGQRGAMNAVLVRGDEAGCRGGGIPHGLVTEMAGEAEALLRELQGGGLCTGTDRDGRAMAGEAGRGPG
jgi:hypothetical protein